jgi:hypothetical protein
MTRPFDAPKRLSTEDRLRRARGILLNIRPLEEPLLDSFEATRLYRELGEVDGVLLTWAKKLEGLRSPEGVA